MKINKHKNYSSILPIFQRHWDTSIQFITLRKIINLIILFLEKSFGKTKIIGRPYFIKIEPTNKCNLNCKGCLHAVNRSELQTNSYLGDMKFEQFQKIINELEKYLLKVSLYIMGESLLHKDIAKMVKYLTTKNIGSVVSSNMNYITEKLAKDLVKNKLTHLIVSLDGYDEKSYGKYRQNGSFQKVINNIKLIQKEKKEQKSKYPIIEIQAIDLNYITNKDISKIKKISQELKVEKFTVKEDVSPNYKKSNPKNKGCFWLYGNPQIHWNGTIQPCCYYYEYKNNNFGNILENSFEDIWNNEKYQAARKYFKTGKKENIDLKCYNCIFFKKN